MQRTVLSLTLLLAACRAPEPETAVDNSFTVAPFGSWTSPLTARVVARAGRSFWPPLLVDGDAVIWPEVRPDQGGRTVIVRATADGRTVDLIAPPFDARSRVCEYGGGAFTAGQGAVYFSHGTDSRIYRAAEGDTPRGVTPESGGKLRYADLVLDRRRGRLLAVREDRRGTGEAIHTIVAVDLARGGEGEVLVQGADFYSSPRISPDGAQLAWLSWNHPNMPWDGTELWVARLGEDGAPIEPRRVAGGPTESVLQPAWSPGGVLHFISDRDGGWWNLFRLEGEQPQNLTPLPREFGLPRWVFGISTFDFVDADRILCTFVEEGRWQLALLDSRSRVLTPLKTPFTTIRHPRVQGGRAYFYAGSPTLPWSVVALELGSGRHRVLRRELDLELDRADISVPRYISFPTREGRAHGYFYRPANRRFRGPKGARPPLVVNVHGGPTGAANDVLSPTLQFWTGRGFAVLDLNYGGSTGHGRAYRERLRLRWGITDVEDAMAAARHLARTQQVDGSRMVIRGRSAGGYTVLMVLAREGNPFRAGASYFGLSDLELFARQTHKFESRYVDGLLAPRGPTQAQVLRERSPIHHLQHLRAPVIFFQGLEDAIVPPNQAERMVQALRAKGVDVTYLPFAGEGHGFRRAETVERALEAELAFYGRALVPGSR